MNKKILLVDDDADDLVLTQRILVGNGYEVLTAENGLGALDICSRRKSEIFAAVMDILMPNADGRGLAVKMKDMAPRTHIILFSHYGFRYKSKKWGVEAIDHIMKNDGERLIALLKEYEMNHVQS